MSTKERATVEKDGADEFVRFQGERIAKRDQRRRVWVAVAPYIVTDGPGKRSLIIERDGVRVQDAR
jgi:hypothetical protein